MELSNEIAIATFHPTSNEMNLLRQLMNQVAEGDRTLHFGGNHRD